jgi:hypothetical protein
MSAELVLPVPLPPTTCRVLGVLSEVLEVGTGVTRLFLRFPKIPAAANASTATVNQSKTSRLKRRGSLAGAGGTNSATVWLTGFEPEPGFERAARDVFFLFDDFFLLAIFLL